MEGYMKHRLPLVSLGLLMAAAGAQAQELGTFRAELTGFEEVPALSSPARGNIRMSVAPDGSSVSWVLQYAGIPTAVLQAHIHFGQMSVNGGISVFLCTNLGNGPAGTQACPPQGGRISGTIKPVDVIGPGDQGIAPGEFAELVRAIRAGATYANVHTDKFKGGEIRGQIPGQHD
jgi:hypothetical protein